METAILIEQGWTDECSSIESMEDANDCSKEKRKLRKIEERKKDIDKTGVKQSDQ